MGEEGKKESMDDVWRSIQESAVRGGGGGVQCGVHMTAGAAAQTMGVTRGRGADGEEGGAGGGDDNNIGEKRTWTFENPSTSRCTRHSSSMSSKIGNKRMRVRWK